jgi:hypothetical protein
MGFNGVSGSQEAALREAASSSSDMRSVQQRVTGSTTASSLQNLR